MTTTRLWELSESIQQLETAIAAGNSVIVLGEAGTGKTDFALALHEENSCPGDRTKRSAYIK